MPASRAPVRCARPRTPPMPIHPCVPPLPTARASLRCSPPAHPSAACRRASLRYPPPPHHYRSAGAFISSYSFCGSFYDFASSYAC
eukprot:1187189-Prorocentrum_minimum.AAC.1